MKFGKVLYGLARKEVERIAADHGLADGAISIQSYVRGYRVGCADGRIDEKDRTARKEQNMQPKHGLHDTAREAARHAMGTLDLVGSDIEAMCVRLFKAAYKHGFENGQLKPVDYSAVEFVSIIGDNDGPYKNVTADPPWTLWGFPVNKTENEMPLRITKTALQGIVHAFLAPDSMAEAGTRQHYLKEKLQGNSAMAMHDLKSSEVVLASIAAYLLGGAGREIGYEGLPALKPEMPNTDAEIKSEADTAMPKAETGRLKPWQYENVTLSNVSRWADKIFNEYGETVNGAYDKMQADLEALRKAAIDYGLKEVVVDAVLQALRYDSFKKLLLANTKLAEQPAK